MGILKNLVNAKVSGNVGSMNFRKRGSQTVVAERSYSNSSKGAGASSLQRTHRSRLANIVNFFRVIAAIEARAWQNKPANTSDFNMLSKFNLAASPIFLTKQEAQARACVIAPYEVSRGSLPALTQVFDTAGFCLGVKVGDAFNFAQNTIGALSEVIIANNAEWRNGDKLSLALLNHQYVEVAGLQVPKANVMYIELTLDVADQKSLTSIPGWALAAFAVDTDGMMCSAFACAAAFAIHSRKVNGILETSAQSIIMKDMNDAIYVQYTSDAQKQLAMNSYGYQGDVLLTPGTVSDTPAADIKIASVTSVTYGGNVVGDGGSIQGGSQLVINGADFTNTNIAVAMNGVKFVPQQATPTKRVYTPTQAGTLTIIVNGVVAYTLTCSAAPSGITSFKWGVSTYTTPQSNRDAVAGVPVNLEVFGADLGEISATGATVSSASGDATHRTAVISIPDGQGQYTVSCGTIVIVSGSYAPDSEQIL